MFLERMTRLSLRDAEPPYNLRQAARQQMDMLWAGIGLGIFLGYAYGWVVCVVCIATGLFRGVMAMCVWLMARKLDRAGRHGSDTVARGVVPEEFDLLDPLHVAIIDRIRERYSSLLADRNQLYAACMYQPVSLLPYPKATIRKAFQALLDVAERRRISLLFDPSFCRPDIVASLQIALAALDDFVEAPAGGLPTDPRENLLAGSQAGRLEAEERRPGALPKSCLRPRR